MARSLARSILALALSMFALGALAIEPHMRVQASARQADGKIIYGGWSNDHMKTVLARLHPDGTRDEYFGGCCAGTAMFDGTVDFILKSIAVLPDGKILLLAERAGQVVMVRFDSAGVLDTSFGSQTPGMVVDSQSVDLRVNAIVGAPDGGVLGFGSLPPPNGYTMRRAAVVRYNPDGSRDMSFGEDGARLNPTYFGEFKAAAVSPGGAVVAAGYANVYVHPVREFLVAKFLPDGTPDMGFGSGGWANADPTPDQWWQNDEALAVAVDAAGNLMAVGRTVVEYSFESLLVAVRFSPTGAVLESTAREVTTENSPFSNQVVGTAVAAIPDGDFVIVGTVLPPGGNAHGGQGFITQGLGGDVRGLPNGGSEGDALDFVHSAPGGQFIVLGSRNTYNGSYDSRRIRYFTGPMEYDTDFAQDYPWDDEPNPFAIQPVAGAAPSTEVTSAPFRITGLLIRAPVRLEGGTVSVGCSGDYLPYAYVENGQWLCVRVLTGETSGTTTAAAVTIGYYQQATFSVTTVGPPQTTITSTPPEPSGRYALFYYAADSVSGPLLGYECRVDANPFAPCPDNNHVQVGPLEVGSHTFEVRAINSYGADPTPAIHAWNVAPPPDTYITSGPAGRSGGTATFEFKVGPWPVDAYFLCRLDESGGWQPCTSPKTYTSLREGWHQFEVYATTTLDADFTPAQHGWFVDLTAPDTDITGWSGNATYVPTTTFQYISVGEPAATFECSLDGGPWQACPGGSTSVTVSPGSHSFSVRAVDDLGNADPTPDTKGWIYFDQPPETTILSGPGGTVASTTATFTYSSSNMPSLFECALQGPGHGGLFATCYSGGVTYSGLANGAYVFAVRARTNDGTVDATPAQRDFIVDTVSPITAITAGPGGTVNNNLATFEFAANESGVEFACTLDGAPEAPCTSPVVLPGLADGSHTFSVAGTDAAGNRGAFAMRTWQVDLSGPDTSITTGPSGATAQSTATFTFASNEAGSTFECRLDGTAFSACTSPASYPGLAEGAHAFEVRALDALGNADPSPATAAWTVDTSAPDTVIDSGPSGTTGQSTATFTFHASEAGTSFECALDHSIFEACASGVSYTGIGNGMHLFEVRARDAQGNVDATPASGTWSVDLAQPATTITSGPSVFTAATGATFTFTSSEPGTFFCSLDGAAFTACASPVSYAALDSGTHGFSVFATDAYGNADDSPATWTWVVDTVAPETTITTSPGAASNSTTATFGFVSSEADSTFECRLDAGAWGACTSPKSYSGLATGSHTFRVRARDFLDNQDASPATHAWIIDRTAPGTSITSGPNGNNNSSTVTFTFSSSEPGAGFECRLDGAAYAPCASPLTYGGLAVGSHTFRVRSVDAAGNVDGSPASRTFGVK